MEPEVRAQICVRRVCLHGVIRNPRGFSDSEWLGGLGARTHKWRNEAAR